MSEKAKPTEPLSSLGGSALGSHEPSDGGSNGELFEEGMKVKRSKTFKAPVAFEEDADIINLDKHRKDPLKRT